MAHADKEMHGRNCASALAAMLHHSDVTITRQEKEIKDLKRKLEVQTKYTQFYKNSRKNLMDENEELSDRLTHTRRFMRDNFDAVRDCMDIYRQSGSSEEAYWRNAYNSLQEVSDIVNNHGEDDSEKSDSE